MRTLDLHRSGMPDLQFVLLVTVLCTSRLTALNIPNDQTFSLSPLRIRLDLGAYTFVFFFFIKGGDADARTTDIFSGDSEPNRSCHWIYATVASPLDEHIASSKRKTNTIEVQACMSLYVATCDRQRWSDHLLGSLGWYPWQCKRCRTRSYFRLCC